MAKKRQGKTRDYVETANRTLRENPATSLLGFEAVSVTQGRAVLKMEVQAKHRQLHGVVHGGILAALATVELKINYLEAVPAGRVKAVASVLRTGRNFAVAECELVDSRGKLAAKALLTFGAAGGHSLK